MVGKRRGWFFVVIYVGSGCQTPQLHTVQLLGWSQLIAVVKLLVDHIEKAESMRVAKGERDPPAEDSMLGLTIPFSKIESL